jgi:hypothetical protein
MINTYIKSILAVFLCFVVFNLCGCKSDSSEPTEEQIILDKMTKTWLLDPESAVLLDGQDVTINFQGFSVTLNSDKTFSSINGNDPVWPESGLFEFETVNGVKNLNRIIRGDGVIIDITELSNNTFTIEFFYDPASSGGRTEAVQGKFEFNLVSE